LAISISPPKKYFWDKGTGSLSPLKKGFWQWQRENSNKEIFLITQGGSLRAKKTDQNGKKSGLAAGLPAPYRRSIQRSSPGTSADEIM